MTSNKDDSWKDTAGAYDHLDVYRTLRELEAMGAVFDYDGSELQEIMKSVTFDPNDLVKFSVEGKDQND